MVMVIAQQRWTLCVREIATDRDSKMWIDASWSWWRSSVQKVSSTHFSFGACAIPLHYCWLFVSDLFLHT